MMKGESKKIVVFALVIFVPFFLLMNLDLCFNLYARTLGVKIPATVNFQSSFRHESHSRRYGTTVIYDDFLSILVKCPPNDGATQSENIDLKSNFTFQYKKGDPIFVYYKGSCEHLAPENLLETTSFSFFLKLLVFFGLIAIPIAVVQFRRATS